MTTTAPPLLPGSEEQVTPDVGRSWSGREHAKRWRGLLVLVAALVVLSIATVVVKSNGSTHGTMDPLSYDPDGGRALATLLSDRGVDVQRLNNVGAVLAGAKTGTTVVVADPVDELDLSPLRRLPTGVTVVLISPDDASLAAAQPGMRIVGSLSLGTRALDCDQPSARLADTVYAGGDSYASTIGGASQSCYLGTLFVRAAAGGPRYVDVGSADTLSNANLGRDGNAALGIGLLGGGSRVLWLVPGPIPTDVAGDGTTPLTKLLPGRLGWAVLQAVIGVALLMLWRARRLGRVVAEPLPVVIRASETVEGLGRLYRAGRSRQRAATALRTAALSRMAPRLGLRREDGTAAMVSAVVSRTSRKPLDVTALLYGAEPVDDRALVTLADQLDALEAEVRRS